MISLGRVRAGNTLTIDRLKRSPMSSAMRASRDPGSKCGDKMSGGTVTRSFQGYGFIFQKKGEA